MIIDYDVVAIIIVAKFLLTLTPSLSLFLPFRIIGVTQLIQQRD